MKHAKLIGLAAILALLAGAAVAQVAISVYAGQVVIAVTGTAVQIPSRSLINGLVVKAKSTNNAACGTVGASGATNTYDGTGNAYGLCPGEAISFGVANAGAVYVNGTAGDVFTFAGN